MGEGSGTACSALKPARPLWLSSLWRHRTRITGYLGIIGASVQMAVAEGQHWPMLLLGATVAAIGHYNDQHPDQS